MLKVTLDDAGATVVLTGLIERLGPGRLVLMEALGRAEVGSVRRTIHESGIPAGSYEPLNTELTREGTPLYTELTREPTPLYNKGTLIGGIDAEPTPELVTIFSSLNVNGHDIGAIQHYGMTIHAKPKDEGGKGFLAWQSADGTWHYAQTVTIPARPFMEFRPEDPAMIEGIAFKFVEGVGAALGE
jgi:phage gpG-like protein